MPIDLSAKLRQGTIRRLLTGKSPNPGDIYLYANYCLEDGAVPLDPKLKGFYEAGLRLIEEGYTIQPIPADANPTLSAAAPALEPQGRLEDILVGSEEYYANIRSFLDEADRIFSLSTNYTAFPEDKKRILRGHFRRFNPEGVQPLYYGNERPATGRKRQTPYAVGVIFENAYRSYQKMMAKLE